jgi:hypothetical protein
MFAHGFEYTSLQLLELIVGVEDCFYDVLVLVLLLLASWCCLVNFCGLLD